jgi:hypothetical protein
MGRPVWDSRSGQRPKRAADDGHVSYYAASAATSNCTRRGHFKMYQPERCKVRRNLV